MTYGFSPENWPAFRSELIQRGIEFGEIERVELRPESDTESPAAGPRQMVTVTVTLRSGRVESWRQGQRVDP